MGNTSDSWDVDGELTVDGGSCTVSAGHLYANAGDVVARDYVRFGVDAAGYLTNGNYNWMHSDGNGIKMPMVTVMDLGGSSFYRLYVQNGNVRAMPA